MAATLTTDNTDTTYVSFPIVKTETTPEGHLLVYGKATDGSVDSDEQIVDPDWSGKALEEWLSSGGNVRVQHNAHRDPAGRGVQVDIDRDGDGGHWVKSLVVEPVVKSLVQEGVLRAYSVGIMRPKVVSDNKARGGRIVDGELGEISLVDRPANRNCGISLVKAAKDGSAEVTGDVWGDTDAALKAATGNVTKTGDGQDDAADKPFSPADMARIVEKKGR
ncbi:HK97 family phage prohead protease [Actinoallomurus rhizosphaericola]|uniref:hypothetical protein n=1 Tax=Actinoallomurus rhizosphaericola TaxID=2952536 RepID=UPI0020933BE4|nr:hypothetical protein [Actinoallomurus rhizosphaericola]MCO5999789.1 hypothetical protein [Actinoallomurus rhizosphaericola]